MGSLAGISQRHIFLHKRAEFNTSHGPNTTIFNAWNMIESFKKKFKLWLNMIAEGNNEMFQSYSDYIMEANNFYSQNSVSDIIAAHLKMLLLLLSSL